MITTAPHAERLVHVVLTRFNVPSGGREQNLREQPDWLSGRFRLFDQFCLPSIAAQTQQDFRWLVFFDINTPSHFREQIERYRSISAFEPVFVAEWTTELVHQAIATRIPGKTQFLLTTRLDNDDGLHPRYLETLRASVRSDSLGFYNFPTGLIYRSGRFYRHDDYNNAFISYLEPCDGFATVWKTPHHKIASSGEPLHQLSLPNAWLQVVHSNNVSNRVKGTRIHPRVLGDTFSHLRNVYIEDTQLASAIWESVCGAPIRQARESAIRYIKLLLRH